MEETTVNFEENNDVADESTDNLETESEETQEPDTESDNSEKNDSEEKPEDTEQLILDKFKSYDDLTNAYTEQEKQLGKMSNELGELRKVKEEFEKLNQERNDIAKAYGFDSVEQMQQASQQLQADQDLANFTADEYAKHINECDYPDEMRNLLIRYKQNPTKDLLDTIEEEFSKDTLKEVERNLTLRKGQLDYQRNQALYEQEAAAVQQYLDDVTAKYDDDRYFKNEEFKSLYADLFKSFGTNLKTDYAIEKLEKYVQSRIANHQKTQASQSENEHATDAIGGLEGGGANEDSGKSVIDMSESELRKALRTKYKNV